MTQAFSRLGTKVSVANLANRLLVQAEQDAADLLQNQFKKEGIKFYNNSEN
jgi:pyruvate/2-oxoglutarate dehydrogenase complex dihydrolipoamide dehydrogenase (E3) component